jgi:hypothetical protein
MLQVDTSGFTPIHGFVTRPGDEFNRDEMAYCAKCCTSHTRTYLACDGFRGGWPLKEAAPSSALDVQVAGGHYKDMKIQPVEFIHANKLGFLEGCIVKRICRWRAKDGVQDLEKIKHEVDLLIELERRGKQA